MNVVLPDQLEASISPEQACLDFAVGLYTSGRVTLGRAAQVANLSTSEFQQELGRRRIPASYDLEELEHDLRSLGLRETDEGR
jgi:predicted HTH domain antitoxin